MRSDLDEAYPRILMLVNYIVVKITNLTYKHLYKTYLNTYMKRFNTR